MYNSKLARTLSSPLEHSKVDQIPIIRRTFSTNSRSPEIRKRVATFFDDYFLKHPESRYDKLHRTRVEREC